MAVEIIKEENGLYLHFDGLLGDHLVQKEVFRIYDCPEFQDYRYVIFNLLDVEKIKITTDTVFKMSSIDKEASKINSDFIVIMVTQNMLAYGLFNMRSKFGSNNLWTYKTFKNLEDARVWLENKLTLAPR